MFHFECIILASRFASSVILILCVCACVHELQIGLLNSLNQPCERLYDSGLADIILGKAIQEDRKKSWSAIFFQYSEIHMCTGKSDIVINFHFSTSPGGRCWERVTCQQCLQNAWCHMFYKQLMLLYSVRFIEVYNIKRIPAWTAWGIHLWKCFAKK